MGGRITHAGKALLLAAIYFFAYRFAWSHSADQFFLPAGLRIASLLFLPYRYWPSIFLGDAAAMISMRVPIAQTQGISLVWAYGSSVLLCPIVSLVPLMARKLFPAIRLRDRWMPAILLPSALWAVSVSTALNFLLGYPVAPDIAAYVYRFGIGQYLAMLIAVMPTLLWLRRGERYSAPLFRDAVIGVAVLLSTHAAAGAADQPWLRLIFLGCMAAPVLTLTARHGWRGAALGISTANLLLGLSMPTTGVLGNQDTAVFVTQQTMAVMSTFMLVVGSMMSTATEKTRRMTVAAIESRALARAHDMQTEQALRDRAEELAIAQKKINAEFRETVQILKLEGRFELAMQVNAQSLKNTQMLYQQAAAIYPFRVEKVGLYAALRELNFERTLGGATASLLLHGRMKRQSASIQIATYRCIFHAIDMLPADNYAIQLRSWSLHGRHGFSVRVLALPEVRSVGSKKSRAAGTQLEAKMHAYCGASKRRRSSVFFLLFDGDQLPVRGTTIQDTPLVPSSTLTVKSSEL